MAYKVVIPQDITAPAKDFLKDKGYEVLVGSGSVDPEYLKLLLKDADALLARTAAYPNEVFEEASKLKVIGRFGVGVDNFDVNYLTRRGIWLTIAAEANANAVAEHTIGLMLAAARKFVLMDRQVKSGEWEIRNQIRGRDLFQKTLGLIGFGRIGRLAAEKAYYGFKMKVAAYDPMLKEGSLPDYVEAIDSVEEIFQKSDFVSLHLPCTPQTTGMVNKSLLEQMKPEAILINCARGPIINEADLYQALTEGKLAGAALDVMTEEPPQQNHPLFTLDNVLITPHNAALTYETMDLMGIQAAMGIDDVLRGRTPQWPVNRPYNNE